MVTPAAELEKVLFAALAPLVGRPGRDGAVSGAKYPHISIGLTSLHNWSTGAETGEQLVTVHVWSKESDPAEVSGLMDAAQDRLGGTAIELGDGRVARLRLAFAETRHEAESSAYHGLLRFRASIDAEA